MADVLEEAARSCGLEGLLPLLASHTPGVAGQAAVAAPDAESGKRGGAAAPWYLQDGGERDDDDDRTGDGGAPGGSTEREAVVDDVTVRAEAGHQPQRKRKKAADEGAVSVVRVAQRQAAPMPDFDLFE